MNRLFKKVSIAIVSFMMVFSALPTSYSFTESVWAEEKSGLYHEGDVWNYYQNGEIATDTTTLVKYNDSWWYVKDGRIDFGANTLVKYNGKWFYVRGGKVDFSATTVVKYNGSWWYVHNGEVDFSAHTLCKYNGIWWFINNGRIDWNSETVVKYGSSWYYVNRGRVNWSATGLCKYNGTWWYIQNGRVNFNATTLCKYNGSWWFIKDGQINWHERTLVRYGNTWYYVNKGRLDWSFNGTCERNGYLYAVRHGIVDFSVTPIRNNDWVSGLNISKKTDQLIMVSVNDTSVTVSLHDKDADGTWSQVITTNGHIGRNGLGKTVEGDKKTPVGVYYFTKAFGNAADPGCAIDFTHCDSSYYWVDDSDSAYYNQFVSTKYVRKDWSSAEHISAVGDRYNYVLALNYNSACTPGLGSAVFLHCGNSNTTGCIAIPQSAMIQIMRDVRKDCAIVIDSSGNIENY